MRIFNWYRNKRILLLLDNHDNNNHYYFNSTNTFIYSNYIPKGIGCFL